MSITPQNLAWLRQSAAVDDRIAPTPEAAPVATDEELCKVYNDAPGRDFGPAIRAVYNLGRQYEAAQLWWASKIADRIAPTPEAAPPVPETDDGDGAIDRWIDSRPDWPNGWLAVTQCQLTALIGEALEHWGRSAAQPAPPVAPAGGLVERVADAIFTAEGNGNIEDWTPEARAAIREVAAWFDQQGQHGCSLLLREESDR